MRETAFRLARARKRPKYRSPDIPFTVAFARFEPGLHEYYRSVIPGLKLREYGLCDTILNDEMTVEERLNIAQVCVISRPNSPWEVDAVKRLKEEGHVIIVDCVVPETRVLRADLTWVPASEIVTGDEVIGFDEDGAGQVPRSFRKATMTNYGLKRTGLYRVTLESGETLTCTADHKWLACRAGGNLEWMRTVDMAQDLKRLHNRPMISIPRLMSTWDIDQTYESGLLAGAFDADGHVTWTSRNGRKRQGTSVGFSQQPGAFCDRVESAVISKGLSYSTWEGVSKSALGSCAMRRLTVSKFDQVLRFLGSVRPARLLERWLIEEDLSKHQVQALKYMSVRSVEEVGLGDVVMLSSDSGTYLANGYGCHNTDDYVTLLYKLSDSLAKIWTNETISNFEQIVRLSDMVTVSVKPLADRMKEMGAKQVAILDNAMDPRSERWDLPWPEDDGKVRLGWIAGFTHADDAEIIEEPVKRIMEKYSNVIFTSVGYMPPWAVDLDPERLEIRGTGGIMDFAQFSVGIDIALGPLAETDFNLYRSTVKFWESTCAGSCFVASEYGPYERDLRAYPGAYTCNSSDDWVAALSDLIESTERREQVWKLAVKHLMDASIDYTVQRFYRAYRQAVVSSDIYKASLKVINQRRNLWVPSTSSLPLSQTSWSK